MTSPEKVPFDVFFEEHDFKKPRLTHTFSRKGKISMVHLGHHHHHHHDHEPKKEEAKIDLDALTPEERKDYFRFGADALKHHHCTHHHHGMKSTADLGPLIDMNEVREILDRFKIENKYLHWTDVLHNKRKNMTPEQVKDVKRKIRRIMKALANVKTGELSWGLDDSHIKHVREKLNAKYNAATE